MTMPGDAEAWRSAGGESYCDNIDFPSRLAERWAALLARPDFGNAGFDKGELAALKEAATSVCLMRRCFFVCVIICHESSMLDQLSEAPLSS